MTIIQMLEQSVVLTLLGMGIVFSFLVILVLCVSGMGNILRVLGFNKDFAISGGEDSPSQGGNQANTAAVVAAISGAVSAYRKENS